MIKLNVRFVVINYYNVLPKFANYSKKIKAQTLLTGWIMDKIKIKRYQDENNQNTDYKCIYEYIC